MQAQTNAKTNSFYQLTDQTLISLVVINQPQAYTVLVQRYEQLLCFVLRRYLSDPEVIKEVIQDTFVRAFRALPNFRGESKFGTWLCKIAISQALNYLRSKKRTATAVWIPIEDTTLLQQEGFLNSEMALEREEKHTMLQQAMQQLCPQDATVLKLFYLQEQSIEEIGHVTGWSTTNIKSRLSRARVRLRHVVERA